MRRARIAAALPLLACGALVLSACSDDPPAPKPVETEVPDELKGSAPVAADLTDFDRFLEDKLMRVPGIRSMRSSFALRTMVRRQVLPVARA